MFDELPKSLHKIAFEIINLIPSDDKWLVYDHEIQETAHGYVMSITKVHRVKHSPDGDWDILSYSSPRLYPEQMRTLLNSGKVRWIEYGSWRDGKCINIGLEFK